MGKIRKRTRKALKKLQAPMTIFCNGILENRVRTYIRSETSPDTLHFDSRGVGGQVGLDGIELHTPVHCE